MAQRWLKLAQLRSLPARFRIEDMLPYIIAGVSFICAFIGVCLTSLPIPRWALGLPALVVVLLFSYLFVARFFVTRLSSTAELIVPFGFFWSALGSIPAAMLGALARHVLLRWSAHDYRNGR